MKISMSFRALVLVLPFVLSACASSGMPTPMQGTSDARDPFETYNRAVFRFNKTLDDNAIKPIAQGYNDYIPGFVRSGVGNFFGNIGDVWTAANNFMQGKVRDGSSDVGRVVFNSTFGLVGLIDVATPMGLPKHDEDFGQTLGVWGVQSGPYFILPLFGPSTVRDAFARPVDMYVDPINQFEGSETRLSARVVRLIDDRAAFLGSTSIMEDAALDPYQFYRDAYLQRRQARVRDGRD